MLFSPLFTSPPRKNLQKKSLRFHIRRVHNQRHVRVHRHRCGPKRIGRLAPLGKRHHLPHGSAQLVDCNQRLASAQPVLRVQILHRHRLHDLQRAPLIRPQRRRQCHVPANDTEPHAALSAVEGCCTASTRPTTTSRAGVLFPSFERAMSPSVETSTVSPRAAPIQSTTTFGSTAAVPSASSRRATRNLHPSNVGCFAVATTVPSIRARNIPMHLRPSLLV